ncbi:MAG TPA: hypothetical protein VN956_03460 [Pyrinomonadaceae bacterium]|nr:hypothetical protein [Pyrinomonadaceae bacterium]
MEIDDRSGVWGVKVRQGILELAGALEVNGLVREIDAKLALLIDHIENGSIFDDNPLSSFVIKKRPNWERGPDECRRREIVEECRRHILEMAPSLVMDGLRELLGRGIKESLVAFVVEMTGHKAWVISKRGKKGKRISAKTMCGNYAAGLAKSKAKQIVEGCEVTRAKKRVIASQRYQLYYGIIKGLRKDYFSTQSGKLRRTTPDWIPWKEKRLEVKGQYPELEAVLDKVPVFKHFTPRELALEVVAKQLDATIAYAENLISEGNQVLKCGG